MVVPAAQDEVGRAMIGNEYKCVHKIKVWALPLTYDIIGLCDSNRINIHRGAPSPHITNLHLHHFYVL